MPTLLYVVKVNLLLIYSVPVNIIDERLQKYLASLTV